jgi:ERCC4-type nuclease
MGCCWVDGLFCETVNVLDSDQSACDEKSTCRVNIIWFWINMWMCSYSRIRKRHYAIEILNRHAEMKYGKKMPGEVSILVDDREARSGTIEFFRGFGGVSIEVQRLELGDYKVDGQLLVERKTLKDLTESIKDGRLFRQAYHLMESPLRSFIILEGTNIDLNASGMRREAIQGALITLSVYLGIPLLRARDAQESVRLMLYAARQGRAFATGAYPRHGKRPRGKRRTQLHILQGLPSVGPERARRLLETFETVEGVLTASEEALSSVDGIGPNTAQSICWAVREPESV